MEYKLEELLPVVQRLAQQYTSGESSTVTYETAESLMEAVVYCTEIFQRESGVRGMLSGERVDALQAYQYGYKMVLEKAGEARELYDHLIKNFQDFGCRNLHDTIVEGMPEFFLRYDARFRSQDAILSLDYPLLYDIGKMQGAEKIYQYLKNLHLECGFLRYFPQESVEKLLDEIEPDGRIHFYGNICEEVLVRALGCMLAGRRVDRLYLHQGDRDRVIQILKGEEEELKVQKICQMISYLVQKGMGEGEELEEYLMKAARGAVARYI